MNFRQYLLDWISLQVAPAYQEIVSITFVLLWILLCAFIIHSFLKKILLRLISRLDFANKKGSWLNTLNKQLFFHRFAMVIQGAIVKTQCNVWLVETSFFSRILNTLSDLWMLFYGLLTLFALLDTFALVMRERLSRSHVLLKGIIQTVKLILCLLVGLITISTLVGKSPVILLSGLGALSAVIMLVFKDPILGLVAGIQLSANNMLTVGDWLEMPKYNADGDVIEIGLTTVKVQNFDKTITTIPTYALISDSFKNWRGMSESGGRRIKRSLLINTSTISFLKNEDLDRLMKNDLLSSYISEKNQLLKSENMNKDMSLLLNGRRLTNIGTFRKYLLSYLESHPSIHQERTLLVRQLAPTKNGLPIEIYVFANTTEWASFEDIQGDIFDHIFAVLPEFGLRVHEAPTGYDINNFIENSK